jgi:DNA polymerase III sliding clamp (beta) subunit (PCNA family)
VSVGDNGHARFATTNLDRTEDGRLIAPIFSAIKCETPFPKIDAVVPKKKAKLEIGINAEYLIDVLKAAVAVKRHADKKAMPYVKLSFINANSVVQIDCQNTETGQTFFAMIMPTRL